MEVYDLPDILKKGAQNGELTYEEIIGIQGRLWELLGTQTKRYTKGDSSSVRVETAEELLRSICFTIGLLLKSGGDTGGANAPYDMSILLECDDMEALLKEGQKKLRRLVEIGKLLLIKAKEGILPIENISYHETIISIEGFFRKYDIMFFAHEIPCSIDYQLCHAVPDELQGIKYINEYLRRIILENRFCSRFDSEKIIRLLEAYCVDYRELLINIYEPVAVNALGIALAYDDVAYSAVAGLNVTEKDRIRLLKLFHRWDDRELMQNLRQAAIKVSKAIRVSGASDIDYLIAMAESLCPRIRAVLPTEKLDGIFISFSL